MIEDISSRGKCSQARPASLNFLFEILDIRLLQTTQARKLRLPILLFTSSKRVCMKYGKLKHLESVKTTMFTRQLALVSIKIQLLLGSFTRQFFKRHLDLVNCCSVKVFFEDELSVRRWHVLPADLGLIALIRLGLN